MILLITFIALMVIGVPIAYVLGLSSVAFCVLTDNLIWLGNLPQKMFTGANNYALLCVPLFLLAGEFMNYGGITKCLLDMTRALVGHLRGGLAHVVILLSAFMSAIIGSATAECAICCKMLVPEMEKDGYDREFGAALAAAASILGPIIPPGMTLVVFGVVAGLSISGLFAAAILPGILLTVAFMVVVGFQARKYNFPTRPKAGRKELRDALIKGLPALAITIIIFAGMFGGVFSPTETAAIATVLSAFVGAFVYRELRWADIPKIITESLLTTSCVLLIVAAANYLGFILAIEQIPQLIAQAIMAISINKIVVLILINILLLAIGCFMETFAIIIILYPVFAPMLPVFGIDPIHFGSLVCFNLAIGMITPPVGLCLYVAANSTGISIERILRRIMPYISVSIIVLLVVTYMPWLSTWLANLIR